MKIELWWFSHGQISENHDKITNRRTAIAAFGLLWYLSDLPMSVSAKHSMDLDSRRPGGKDAARLGKEIAR